MYFSFDVKPTSIVQKLNSRELREWSTAIQDELNRRANVVLTEEEIEFLRCDKKIDAIKAFRLRTGSTLLEAKSTIESWLDANPFATPATTIKGE